MTCFFLRSHALRWWEPILIVLSTKFKTIRKRFLGLYAVSGKNYRVSYCSDTEGPIWFNHWIISIKLPGMFYFQMKNHSACQMNTVVLDSSNCCFLSLTAYLYLCFPTNSRMSHNSFKPKIRIAGKNTYISCITYRKHEISSLERQITCFAVW